MASIITRTGLLGGASGATFSECERYRYSLWRIWDDSKPVTNFVMLNPSTADESASDPTVTRCLNFATAWGCGGLIVTNLFAFRATDPDEMFRSTEPVGAHNDQTISDCAEAASIVVCAWGNHGRHLDRSAEVTFMLERAGVVLRCLKQNSGGEPAHPLYLPSHLRSQIYTRTLP